MATVDTDVQIDEKIKVTLTEPKRYKVLLLNDDKTPIDFVIELLMSVFKHTQESAKEITLAVHEDGSGIAGVYNFEIAEQKSIESTTISRQHGFPLQLKVEQE